MYSKDGGKGCLMEKKSWANRLFLYRISHCTAHSTPREEAMKIVPVQHRMIIIRIETLCDDPIISKKTLYFGDRTRCGCIKVGFQVYFCPISITFGCLRNKIKIFSSESLVAVSVQHLPVQEIKNYSYSWNTRKLVSQKGPST